MPRSKVRIQARIDDEVEVEHDEGASDEEIIDLASQDWSFVEGKEFTSEIVDRDE